MSTPFIYPTMHHCHVFTLGFFMLLPWHMQQVYGLLSNVGARTEMPGCSLCMGNQARGLAGATVLSTSTRHFPIRLGDGANVYLASAELAAVGGILADAYRISGICKQV